MLSLSSRVSRLTAVRCKVVAPVRETAAQALATLLPRMPLSSIVSVQRILIDMVEQGGAPPSRGLDGARAISKIPTKVGKGVEERGKYVWQVRHAGLLGLKYLVAVKGDLLRHGDVTKSELQMELDEKPIRSHALLKGVLDAALLGYVVLSLAHDDTDCECSLRDQDDDVRSAAAATLTPIADSLVDRLPAELNTLVTVLWECLADLKDDLSSSIGGVMDLLGQFIPLQRDETILTLRVKPNCYHSLPCSTLCNPHRSTNLSPT